MYHLVSHQGGHLSPLLFILFVNSISKWITKAKCLLFADDIKIYLKIDDHESCLALQSNLGLNILDLHLI